MRAFDRQRAGRHAPAASLLVILLMLALAAWGPARRLPERPRALSPGWTAEPQAGRLLSLLVDGDTVWAGSRDGLGRLDRRSGRWLGCVALGRPATFVRALAVDRTGRLWIGCLQGLYCWDGRTARDVSATLPAPRVNALLRDRHGRLWIGTANGLAVLDDDRPRLAPGSRLLASPIVNALAEDADGGLWVGNTSTPSGGLARLSGGQAQVWRVADGLPHGYVNALRAAPAGVWAACGQGEYGGACLFTAGAQGWSVARRLSRTDGLAGAKARSVLVDRDGDLWVGSENDGLAVLPARGGSRRFGIADGLTHVEVTAMAEDGDGNLWLATLGGATRLSREAVVVAKAR